MSFDAFGFIPPINKAIQRINYVTATPIQQQCIPLVLEGKDVLASAQTGISVVLAVAQFTVDIKSAICFDLICAINFCVCFFMADERCCPSVLYILKKISQHVVF